MSSARAFFFDPGASPPDPLHALSRAASSARSVRVARLAALARVFSSHSLASTSHRSFLIRGASPLALPDTLSHEPLRRLVPFAWLTSRRSFASFFRQSVLLRRLP